MANHPELAGKKKVVLTFDAKVLISVKWETLQWYVEREFKQNGSIIKSNKNILASCIFSITQTTLYYNI